MWKQRAGIKSKKNHAAAEQRVIFGLMPAFLFLSVLLKMNRVRNAKLKKCGRKVAFRY